MHLFSISFITDLSRIVRKPQQSMNLCWYCGKKKEGKKSVFYHLLGWPALFKLEVPRDFLAFPDDKGSFFLRTSVLAVVCVGISFWTGCLPGETGWVVRVLEPVSVGFLLKVSATKLSQTVVRLRDKHWESVHHLWQKVEFTLARLVIDFGNTW